MKERVDARPVGWHYVVPERGEGHPARGAPVHRGGDAVGERRLVGVAAGGEASVRVDVSVVWFFRMKTTLNTWPTLRCRPSTGCGGFLTEYVDPEAARSTIKRGDPSPVPGKSHPDSSSRSERSEG